MSDSTTINVKIGVIYAPRDLEIEVEDIDGFVADFEGAMTGEANIWWITEASGRRRGLVVDKISYVDIEPQTDREVGFG